MAEQIGRLVLAEGGDPEPDLHLAEREQNEELLRAVATLQVQDRTLIALRYFLELPEAEVAAALDVPVGTIKSRLHRTLARLRAVIERDFPDLKT